MCVQTGLPEESSCGLKLQCLLADGAESSASQSVCVCLRTMTVKWSASEITDAHVAIRHTSQFCSLLGQLRTECWCCFAGATGSSSSAKALVQSTDLSCHSSHTSTRSNWSTAKRWMNEWMDARRGINSLPDNSLTHWLTAPLYTSSEKWTANTMHRRGVQSWQGKKIN